MNIEKQTYLNTEQLQGLFEKNGIAVSCYGAGSGCGGVRFYLSSKAKVTFEVRFHAVSAAAALRVDGTLVATTSRLTSRFELTLGKGDHVFDLSCSSHGGFVISASAHGLEPARAYFDRVGGHANASETVVYMSNGDRDVVSYRKTSSSLETATLSTPLYDDANLYDKTNDVYTQTKAYVTSVENGAKVLLNLSRDLTITVDGKVEDVAVCDGRTLDAGADYLAAYVSDGGKLTLLRCNDGQTIGTSDSHVWEKPVLRVSSAQKGSVLMTQSPDYVWTAYFFNGEGDGSVAFGQNVFHYSEIPLCRNRYVAPDATIDEEDGTPVFFYKTEDGRLMRMAYGDEPSLVGYGEGYHAGENGGFVQFAGEVKYQAAE